MKRRFRTSSTALLSAALLATPTLATPAHAQVTLGVEAGVTSSTFEGDNAGELESTTGLMAGVHLAFPLGDILSVVPGAYFVQKGGELGDFSQTLSYLEIPVLLSVDVLEPERPVGFRLFAGPQVSFQLGYSDDGAVPAGFLEEDEISGTDFGLIAGGGLSSSFGGTMLFVNGGLDVGLTSIDDSDADGDVKNSVWFLTGGIAFPLGG